MTPVAFPSPAAFRRWLARHHGTAGEIVLALAKKHSGLSALTYRQALEEALCYGWIDGVTRRIDEGTYALRFTPRRASSYWSAVNVRRYAELEALGRIAPPGRACFEARDQTARRQYSFENRPVRLSPSLARRFKASPDAWAFFGAQPPGYRRTAIFWVMSAVREETRERRLTALIRDSAAHRRLQLLSPGRRSSSTRP